MKQVTVEIPEDKYPYFIDLVKNLSYIKKVTVAKKNKKEEILKGLKEAVKEVKEIESGKKKPVLLKDFLNDL